MRIVLITPYGAAHRNGNWHTAARWTRFLREAGHTVRVQVEWDGREADLMLALHARRSADSIRAFASAYPSRPLLVALTGTDLYRDIQHDADAQRSLELAHRLIVLQARGVDELDPEHAAKTRVIYQSSPDNPHAATSSGHFEVAVIAHLREEKDPFRAALASAHLPDHSAIRITHFGRALSDAMADTAELAQHKLSRWHWAGDVPHKTVLKRLASAKLLVISSVLEGGANVICEALAADVPVLASNIPGNLGMLGDDYPGYFPVSDERALASLLTRTEQDAGFYAELRRHARLCRRLMRPEQEASRLRQVVAEFEQLSR
ncbi:MAG: selenoneine biosynthesis selenosugar synthase SenB [Thiobacillus sp.]